MSEKQIAILKTILQTASAIGANLKIAYPKKQLFSKDKYLRTPGKRIKKRQARIMLPLTMALGSAQIHIIASQPVPKANNFKPGGISVIGERGPELIKVNGRFQLIKQPAITYL